MSTSEPIDLFFNKVHVTAPIYFHLNGTLPYFGAYSTSLSRLFLTGFFYLGLSTGIYHLFKHSRQAASSAYSYLRSLFNAKKFLNPQSPIAFMSFGAGTADHSSRAYALI